MPEIDYVDYTSIQFPSDRLRIADLRQLYPAEFDEKGPPPVPPDPLNQSVCAKHGQPLPPPKQDWLLDQLRAMPTDQTLYHLRHRHPDVFDVEEGIMEAPQAQYKSSRDLYDMLLTERGLARVAYQEAFGNIQQVPSWFELPERDGYREDLSKLYIKFGLARGENEARQMIARFEAAAAAQATPDQPPRRGR